MQTLPYILIGIGAGIFGQNIGATINIHTMKKAPLMAKQKEIEVLTYLLYFQTYTF